MDYSWYLWEMPCFTTRAFHITTFITTTCHRRPRVTSSSLTAGPHSDRETRSWVQSAPGGVDVVLDSQNKHFSWLRKSHFELVDLDFLVQGSEMRGLRGSIESYALKSFITSPEGIGPFKGVLRYVRIEGHCHRCCGWRDGEVWLRIPVNLNREYLRRSPQSINIPLAEWLAF